MFSSDIEPGIYGTNGWRPWRTERRARKSQRETRYIWIVVAAAAGVAVLLRAVPPPTPAGATRGHHTPAPPAMVYVGRVRSTAMSPTRTRWRRFPGTATASSSATRIPTSNRTFATLDGLLDVSRIADRRLEAMLPYVVAR